MQLVRQELLGTRVFVFTEGGRILNLARGATLADAAAALDVSVGGDRETGDREDSATPFREGTGKVQGRFREDSATPFICSHNMCEAASLDTELENGDIVCFAATTSSANAEAARLIEGVEPMGAQPVVSWPREVADGGEEADKTGDAAHGRPSRVVGGRAELAELAEGCSLSAPAESVWSICPACLPLPGDDLVCTLDAAGKGMLHRFRAPPRSLQAPSMKCKQLRKQLADGAALLEGHEDACQLIQGTLGDGSEDGENARALTTSLVLVFGNNEPGNLLAVTEACTRHSLGIVDVNSKLAPLGSAAELAAAMVFQFRVQVGSLEQLDTLVGALRALPHVVNVRRDSLEILEEAGDVWSELT